MIFEAAIDVVTGFCRFIISLFPNDPPAPFVATIAGYWSTVWGYASGLGAWLPYGIIPQVFAAVALCVVLGLSIKVIRIVASFLTVGGGSAG